MGDRKPEKIEIRCSEDTLIDFKEFAAGYSEYEQAIRDALNVYEDYPSLFNRMGAE